MVSSSTFAADEWGSAIRVIFLHVRPSERSLVTHFSFMRILAE
jgi:hypothetical protein